MSLSDETSRYCEVPGCDEHATKCVQDRFSTGLPSEMPVVYTHFYCAAHHAQARAAFRAAFFGIGTAKEKE